MTKLQATIKFLRASASRILRAVMRVAKRWAAPGSGPKLVTG